MSALPCLIVGNTFIQMPRRGGFKHLMLESKPHFVESASLPSVPSDLDGVWLYRTGSGLSAILRGHDAITVRNKRICEFAILHHDDDILIGPHHARFYELEMVEVRAGDPMSGKKCTFTHIPIIVGSRVLVCPFCGTLYSEPAWAEIVGQKCMSHGCDFVFKTVSGLTVDGLMEHADHIGPLEKSAM